MDLVHFQNQIKELVGNDKLNESLDLIIQFSQSEGGFEELEKSAIINRGKLDRIDREKMEDRIAAEDYGVMRSQVSAAILILVDEFKKEEPIQIPIPATKSNPSNASSPSTVSQQEIQKMILSQDQMFVKIILLVLVVLIGLSVYFMFNGRETAGGMSMAGFAGTCYVYLNNKSRMLQSLRSSL